MVDRTALGIRILHADRRTNFTWRIPSLSAPYWRFYWNFRGAARVILDGRREELLPETGYLIPPDTDYASDSDADLDHFYVHFLVNNVPLDAPPGIYRMTRSGRLASAVESVAASLPTTPSVFETTGLVLLAMADLPLGDRRAGTDTAVARAAEFAEHHTDRVVSVAELAAAAGCGERTLRRRFLSTTGITPSHYALVRRVERACLLLHFSDATIDAIAQETGFCDRYHFTRAFTSVRGISPAAFRRVAEELSAGRKVPQAQDARKAGVEYPGA